MGTQARPDTRSLERRYTKLQASLTQTLQADPDPFTARYRCVTIARDTDMEGYTSITFSASGDWGYKFGIDGCALQNPLITDVLDIYGRVVDPKYRQRTMIDEEEDGSSPDPDIAANPYFRRNRRRFLLGLVSSMERTLVKLLDPPA